MVPALREAWPGVAPWEWERHPEWRMRALCGLSAEVEAAAIAAQSLVTPSA